MNTNKVNQVFSLRSCQIFDLSRILLLLFVLLSFTSCSDDGCIEADDFGEYEQQILTVKANSSDEACDYDSSKDIIDAEQGSGLKDCFIKGSVQISDSDNKTFSSSQGCSGFTDTNGGITVKNICVEQCRQKCLASNASAPAGAEPMWMPTSEKQEGKNIGVTLTPGAEIYVRATGTVSLSGDKELASIFAGSKKSGLQSFADDLSTNVIQDVKFGTTKSLKFSGMWNDAADDDNSVAEYVGASSSTTAADEARLYSGARRLAIYVINRDGYGFDPNQTNEKQGVIGIPLYPDTDLWTCYYSNNSVEDFKQSDCKSLDYDDSRAQYGINVNSQLAIQTYGLSSVNQSKNLGKFGGVIRWKDDGLRSITDQNDDPFKGCTSDCASLNVSSTGAGYIDATQQYTNSYPFPVELRARIASGGSSCTLIYKIVGNDGVIKNTASTPEGTDDWSWIIGSGWSNPVTLETGDKLTVTSNPGNCGNTVVRVDKIQEITIQNSGLVSFTTLGGVSSNCVINGRVINPNGFRNPFGVSGFVGTNVADFYEYKLNSDDPLNNLSVPVSPSSQSTTSSPFLSAKTWSKKVFVRKGQRIRFSSSSWNGTFTTYAGSTRQCGVGMVMKIEERPAFLCRGRDLDEIANSKCLPEVDSTSGTATKCKEFANECYDSADSVNYCPNDSCQTTWSSSCAVAKNGSSVAVTQNTCDACRALKKKNGAETVTKQIKLPICYDLEEYTGSVANIDATTGFSKEQLANPAASKGAVKLGKFNGMYGNFENFIDSKSKESAIYQQNNIYQLRDPLTFAKSGRVKFLILDGNSFKDVEDDSDAYGKNGDGTKGKNGYKITLSGKQEFVNGEMLEAILCLEDASGIACSPDPTSQNPVPQQIGEQPEVVKLTFNGISAQSKTYYKFDDYGSLIRIANSGVTTPEPVNDNYVAIGSNFYRHDYQFYSDAVLKSKSDSEKKSINEKIAKLRLTFKIKDYDTPNCSISSQTDCSGGGSNCDGIKMDNKFYSASSGVGAGAYCGPKNPPGENGCKNQYFCGNLYSNNSGSYQVTVRVKNKGSNISNMVNGVVTPVVEIMDGKKPDCNTSNPTQAPFNGVKIVNDGYDSNNKQNDNAICSLSEYKSKDSLGTSTCKKQYACSDQNVGQAERVYKLLINDFRYKAILNVTLILMVTFYGVGYLMGVSEFSQSEIIGRVIKIGTIYLFVGPSGWYWFDTIFVKFFKNSTDYLAFVMAMSFDRSPELKLAVDNYNFYDKSVLFSSVDKVFGMFFSSAVQKKVSALLFASIFGWAYLIIIYWGFMAYVYAVANAILLYLTSQIFISILFVLGPIFLITLLFNQTKEMFDKWLSQLISFSLQQIFLLTTLSFFNMMMYEVIKLSLGFRVCWDDVWVINIITRIKLLSFWTVASMPPRLNSQTGVGNTGNATSIPSIFSIMFIWIVASLMQKFIEFMTNVAASISDGIKASDLGSGIKSVGTKMSQMGGKAMSGAWKKLGGEAMVQRIDKNLFDSGELAEKERKEREVKNKKEAGIKSSMVKSGDKAVREFKEKNLDKLAAMTPEEQKRQLKEVHDKAAIDAGKKAGLTEDEAKALMKDKGFKYEGSNVFGAAYQAAKQVADGSLIKSVGERSVSRGISNNKIEAAMKNLDKKGRGEVMDAVKSGKLKLGGRGFLGKFRKNVGDSAKAALGAVGIRGTDNRKAYNQAKKELLAEGAIDNLFFEVARTSEEKEMIDKRMKSNKLASKVNANTNDIKKMAHAAQFAEQADKDEEEDKKTKGEWGKLGNQISRDFRSAKQYFGLDSDTKKGKKTKEDSLKQNWEHIEKMQQGELANEMSETVAKKEQSLAKKDEWINRADQINKSKEMLTAKGLRDTHTNAVAAKEESLKKKNEWSNKFKEAKDGSAIKTMEKLEEEFKKASDPKDKERIDRDRKILSKEEIYLKQSERLKEAENNLNSYTQELNNNTVKENEAKDALDNYLDDSVYVKQLEKLGEANTNANYYKHQADNYIEKEAKIKKLLPSSKREDKEVEVKSNEPDLILDSPDEHSDLGGTKKLPESLISDKKPSKKD